MLLIDGLHAFDFTFDAEGLSIECIDGREHRRWRFSLEQVAAATAEGEQWRLSDSQGEHRLVCMDALRAPEEDEDDDTREDTGG